MMSARIEQLPSEAAVDELFYQDELGKTAFLISVNLEPDVDDVTKKAIWLLSSVNDRERGISREILSYLGSQTRQFSVTFLPAPQESS